MMRMIASALALALAGTTLVPFDAALAQKGVKAKQSIKHSGGGGKARAKPERRPVRQTNVNNRGGNNRGRGDRNSINRGNNRVVAGNTVVVNHNTDRGYRHGGYDHDRHGHWDDDDDGFFEVMGKAAAVTAGVGLTAAVIGEIFDDEPDGCQQSVSNNQTYLFCNGVWYQPVMSGSNMQYVVIEDPR